MTTEHSRGMHDFVDLRVPRAYGGTPTIYGSAFCSSADEFHAADAVFLGIPWAAPVIPEYLQLGYGSNFGDTGGSPAAFRSVALRHMSGFLPELDMAVLERLRLVDAGDVAPGPDMADLLKRVDSTVSAVRRNGCILFTYGGNAGPGSFGVATALANCDAGLTIVNLDAHGDNAPGDWANEDPRQPQWAPTWVNQLLAAPNIDPRNYFHVGLRGPMNDSRVLEWFDALGVPREQLATASTLKQARRDGFQDWLDRLGEDAAGRGRPVWVAVDADVLNIGATPEFGDEPFGPTVDETIDLVYTIARCAGRQRFAGISFMAVPPGATSVHLAFSWMILYALAAVAV